MGRIGLAFLAGHCLLHSLSVLPSWPMQGSVLAFTLAGLLSWSVYRRMAWAAALLLGLASAWLHAEVRLANDLDSELEGRDLLLRGYVASLPGPPRADPRFDF